MAVVIFKSAMKGYHRHFHSGFSGERGVLMALRFIDFFTSGP
jgi:hypothetical protein